MEKARLLPIGLFCILCFSLVCPVFAVSYVDLERTTIGELLDTLFPANIIVTNLESSYEVKLYNSTSGLITNASANSEGTANMTLPSSYRSSTFEGTFRIYDENTTFIFSKWFEDVRGGDIYEARTKIGGLAFGVIALVIGLFAFVLALSSVKVKR